MTNQITDIIDKLAPKIGREQAIKDLQTGLNILNKTNGKAEAKIEIDGKYGVQTHAALENACKTYPAQAIRKSVKTAAISNAVFDTKNKKKVDTGRRIERIYNSFDGGPLECGISYYEYVWCAAGADPCEDCAALDGEVFENYEDIPDHPHPNCQCYVEMVETDKDKKDQCDCWDEIDAMVAEADAEEDELSSMLGEIDNLQDELEDKLSEVQNLILEVESLKAQVENMELCGPKCVVITGFATNIPNDEQLAAEIYNVIQDIEEARQVYEIFVEHWGELKAAGDGRDKYRHAKANCECAELGVVQALWAIVFSVGKEFRDYYTKVIKGNQDAMKILEDCYKDLLADFYGLLKALQHGSCGDKVKDAEKTESLRDLLQEFLKIILSRF